MSLASNTAGSVSGTPSNAAMRPRGRRLAFARVLWFVALLIVFGLYVASMPLQLAHLRMLCAANCEYGQITAANVAQLNQLGLSLDLYFAYQLALNTVFLIAFVAVGAVILWRKSDDWFGIYLALTLVLLGIGFSPALPLIGRQYPALNIPMLILSGSSHTMGLVFFYLFPNGRLVPRWTRWLVPFVAARDLAYVIQPDLLLLALVFIAELGTGLYAQIYRYRRSSNAVERGQTKWFVYLTSVALVGFAVLILLLTWVSPIGQPPSIVVALLGTTGLYCFALFIPISLMLAILRYRLWEIDLLINRTLVYVPLTGILAGLLAATITLSQTLFVALTGHQSELATIITTLIVAAAFTPIKDRLQGIVDKRFKEAPDPSRNLKAFEEQVQERLYPVSVPQGIRRLLEEAVDAFEATGGAAYLESGGDLQIVHTAGEWKGRAEPSVLLRRSKDGGRLGAVDLGAQRNGAPHKQKDREALEHLAKVLVQAIEQDQLP